MTTKIRTAKNIDLQSVIEIIREHYVDFGDRFNLEKFDSDLKDLEKSYFSRNGYFWIAQTDDDETVGMIAIKTLSDKTAEIKRFYVKKKFRRQGIGKQLLKTCLNYVQEKGFQKIILWTDIRYREAQGFYLKNGFDPTEIKKFFDADVPWTAVKFVKKLS